MFDKIKDVVNDITGGGDLGDLNLGGYEKYLDGVTWPISKDELVNAVKNNGGGDDIQNKIKGASNDTFNGPEDVARSASGAGQHVADKVEGKADDLKNRL